jgi:hypothetical protein
MQAASGGAVLSALVVSNENGNIGSPTASPARASCSAARAGPGGTHHARREPEKGVELIPRRPVFRFSGGGGGGTPPPPKPQNTTPHFIGKIFKV